MPIGQVKINFRSHFNSFRSVWIYQRNHRAPVAQGYKWVFHFKDCNSGIGLYSIKKIVDVRFDKDRPYIVKEGDLNVTLWKESEMVEIAEFMKRVIIEKEDVAKVRSDVADFRRDYQKVYYCFENAVNAYKYVRIR